MSNRPAFRNSFRLCLPVLAVCLWGSGRARAQGFVPHNSYFVPHSGVPGGFTRCHMSRFSAFRPPSILPPLPGSPYRPYRPAWTPAGTPGGLYNTPVAMLQPVPNYQTPVAGGRPGADGPGVATGSPGGPAADGVQATGSRASEIPEERRQAVSELRRLRDELQNQEGNDGAQAEAIKALERAAEAVRQGPGMLQK